MSDILDKNPGYLQNHEVRINATKKTLKFFEEEKRFCEERIDVMEKKIIIRINDRNYFTKVKHKNTMIFESNERLIKMLSDKLNNNNP